MNVTLTLQIDNIYEDGDEVRTTATVTVPAPPDPSDESAYEDWAYDHIFAATGTGKTEGDSGYFVEVTETSDPATVPVGTEFEFGL